jgi:kynurenine formamidase
MPDEIFPTATHFLLAPRGHPEKGTTVGTDGGTCILMPAQFNAFRKSRRLHEVEPHELVLRETVVLDVPKGPREPITENDLTSALQAADVRSGDAWLIRTGWGDGAPRERGSDAYLLDTPYLSPEAARFLGAAMKQRETDLLLLDTALISCPDKHLIPEWTTMGPRPLCYPSDSAKAYLQGYLEREVLEDWEADYLLAEAGIMTVQRLVNCGHIQQPRIRVIVAPLRVVRGVGSTCRVVAVEGV